MLGCVNGAEGKGRTTMKTIIRGENIERGESPGSALVRAKEWLGKFVSTYMTPDVEYVMKMSIEVSEWDVEAKLELREV